jgi:4-hydroxy-4-methyl-2-oxoglutarate aldolase
MQKYRVDPMPSAGEVALLAELEKVETATVGHLRYTGFMDCGIQALNRKQKTRAGVAVTVALPPTCSTLLHYAMSHVRPGDILVVDRLGDNKYACLGGAVARAAKQAGIVGVVIDGPCTDVEEVLAEGLAVWCRGVSPITTRQAELGGTFNRPIACGNVPVLPGDIVLADASGVVVFPADEAWEIARECVAREIRVARTMGRLLQGEKLGDITRAIEKVKTEIDAEAERRAPKMEEKIQ